MTVQLRTEHHLEFLSLQVGCTDTSESTLVKMQELLEITCQGSYVNTMCEWKKSHVSTFSELLYRWHE